MNGYLRWEQRLAGSLVAGGCAWCAPAADRPSESWFVPPPLTLRVTVTGPSARGLRLSSISHDQNLQNRGPASLSRPQVAINCPSTRDWDLTPGQNCAATVYLPLGVQLPASCSQPKPPCNVVPALPSGASPAGQHWEALPTLVPEQCTYSGTPSRTTDH